MCWLILRLANSLPEKQENTAESYLNQSQRLTTPNCLMHLKVTPKCLNFPSQLILFSSPQNKKEKKYKHIFAVFPISLDPFFSPECGSSDVLLSSSKFFYESKENSWTSPCFLGKAACSPWSHQVCANSSGQFWGFGHDVKELPLISSGYQKGVLGKCLPWHTVTCAMHIDSLEIPSSLSLEFSRMFFKAIILKSFGGGVFPFF